MAMRKLKAVLPAALAGAAMSACVILPPGEQPPPEPLSSSSSPSFPGLDPGEKSVASVHFVVHAYGQDTAQKVSALAEQLYSKVMADFGVYSFLQSEPYSVYIYANQEEYLRKTRMPAWSGGVSAGKMIYTYYEGGVIPITLAHEMTHLIFHEFMGTDRPEHRWINEGLAVYEEQEAGRAMGRVPAGWGGGSPGTLPFDRMISMAPLSEDKSSAVAWYLQASSVVRYMVERGGRIGVGQFLAALRDGRTPDDAVKTGFPGIWNGIAALEAAWLRG